MKKRQACKGLMSAAAGMIGLMAVAVGTASATPIVSGFNSNTMYRNDDGSVGPVSPGFSLNFFGNTYNQLYVNTNGNITFGSALSTYTPFGLTTNTSIPIIAPFFADVDTNNGGSPVTYGVGTFNGHNAFGVNWLNVTGYGLSTTLRDNIQLILVDRSDVSAGDFNMYFNYGSIQWDTGGASSESAHVGYSNGSGNPGTYYELPGSGLSGAFLDTGPDQLATYTNDETAGQEFLQVRNGTVRQPTTVPEPPTVALLGLGLISLVVSTRRRSKTH